MSIAENPLVGRMKGSMANFTMYTLNDQNVVRGKAFNFKDAKTEYQLVMRERMDLLNVMYQSFASLIRLGFPERPIRLNSQNMFISVNFSTCFEVIDEIQRISYPLLLLSKGSLPKVKVIDAFIEVEGITIRYDANEISKEVTCFDEILACAMLITGELLIARQFIGYDDIGTILLKHPDLQAEDVMCCYVFVRSGDGKKSSSSVYVEL
jgi:hypothetical protein